MSEPLHGMQNTKVLVYSPYIAKDKNNIGDRYFIDAFIYIFPQFEFTFVEEIQNRDLSEFEIVFFGGGSFLGCKPLIDEHSLNQIKKKKIFYIGVGIEDVIHPVHLELIKLAKFIATRSKDQVEKVLKINLNTKYYPDIVYSLTPTIAKNKTPNILIINNGINVPQNNSEHWQFSAFEYFKSEFSQFLDELISSNYKFDFLPFCRNRKVDDAAASFSIVSSMNYRNYQSVVTAYESSFGNVTKLLSQYSMIITQRYHGIVLAEALKIPYICIHHHDKLKNAYPNSGIFLDYYGLNKNKLQIAFSQASQMKRTDFSDIEKDTFQQLKKEVICRL